MAGWDPGLYQQSHAFVWQLGRDVIGLLDPKPGERILDVGCGTGQLSAEIARSGAAVVGIDSSEEMIAAARRNFANLRFEAADVTRLEFHEEFDGVFSNAALHWMRDARPAAAAMARALKPGGRLAVEFGGHGNIRRLLAAVFRALQPLGRPAAHPWYFPTIGEYAGILEAQGLEVQFAALFDRPTPVQSLAEWLRMFGQQFGADAELIARVESEAKAELLRDGQWYVDYRRLRVQARKLEKD